MNDDNPYKKFSKKELILRDHLAIDRTILSNESTMLAYIRTSLAIMAAGATLIHFFVEFPVRFFGACLVFGGIIVLVAGYYRYRKMGKSINQVRRS